MLRSWPCLLALAACHPSSTTGTTDAGPTTTASAVPDAAPPPSKTDFASAGTITLQLQKYLPIEFIAHGSWVALGPKGEHLIVGSPGRGAMFPGNKPIPGTEPSNGGFTNDGKRFFLTHPGQNVVTNEVTVHATNDLHVLVTLKNALDPVWINDELVFDRGGQVFRVNGTETKLVGPAAPAFKDRPKAVVVAPNLESMIVVDRTNGVRRIAIATSGRDVPLITFDVVSKFAKAPEPFVVIAPDASRVCVLGSIRSETTIWCASDDTPAQQIASFADSSKFYAASFIGPNLLSYRLSTVGAVGIADFEKRTTATMTIPGGTTPTDLTPLPGGKLAVARDFYRLGVVNFAEKKFTPLGDDKASPKSVAGVGTDDTAFALDGASLDAGLGVFKVIIK